MLQATLAQTSMKRALTSGQSLIEVVVAVGIIAVVLAGVSDLISRSLGLSSFQADKGTAESIAMIQLNHYRLERDNNPKVFFGDGNPTKDFSACVGSFDTTKYLCKINYQSITNGVVMNVYITWTSGDKEVVSSMSQVLGNLERR